MSQLFLYSYVGIISSLRFDASAAKSENLQDVGRTMEDYPRPSWLSIDSRRRVLYATSNDSQAKTGTLIAFSIEPSGQLTKIAEVSGYLGGAHHIVFDDGRMIACAFA